MNLSLCVDVCVSLCVWMPAWKRRAKERDYLRAWIESWDHFYFHSTITAFHQEVWFGLVQSVSAVNDTKLQIFSCLGLTLNTEVRFSAVDCLSRLFTKCWKDLRGLSPCTPYSNILWNWKSALYKCNAICSRGHSHHTGGLTADSVPELLMQESNQTLIQEPKELQDEGAASSLKHHFSIICLCVLGPVA